MKKTKEQPIEQFVRIIGEENFHRFHVEYLLSEKMASVEELVEGQKRFSINLAFSWRSTEQTWDFWYDLHEKLLKEWRE